MQYFHRRLKTGDLTPAMHGTVSPATFMNGIKRAYPEGIAISQEIDSNYRARSAVARGPSGCARMKSFSENQVQITSTDIKRTIPSTRSTLETFQKRYANLLPVRVRFSMIRKAASVIWNYLMGWRNFRDMTPPHVLTCGDQPPLGCALHCIASHLISSAYIHTYSTYMPPLCIHRNKEYKAGQVAVCAPGTLFYAGFRN